MNIRRGGTSSGGRVRRWRSVAAVVVAAVVTLTACGTTGTPEATAGATRAAATPSASVRSTPARATPTLSQAAPVITSRIARTSEKIRFTSQTISSSSLAKGVVRVQQAGRPGVRIKVYRVRLRNGVVRGRELIRTIVIRQPVARVTVRGTHVDPPKPPKPPAAPAPGAGCDSNYSGACVPVASDVDCAGGSGNGPAYVDGPVRVVGADVYDLDRDGDGWGCD